MSLHQGQPHNHTEISILPQTNIYDHEALAILAVAPPSGEQRQGTVTLDTAAALAGEICPVITSISFS